MDIRRLKSTFTSLTGIEFYRNNPAWGQRMDKDLARLRTDFQPRVLFDIGANVGQTVERFLEYYPDAQVHAFEPVPKTFAQLDAKFGQHPQVHCRNFALSSEAGQRTIYTYQYDVISSLEGSTDDGGSGQEITLNTLDNYVAENNISHIDLLKTDTEGHDISVLEGGRQTLDSDKIHFILSEVRLGNAPATRNPYCSPTPLPDLLQFLEPYNFVCVGVYDQEYIPYYQSFFANALFLKSDRLKST